MQVKPLYKYERAKGKVTVSPYKPEGKPYTDMYRLIADYGKLLTCNGAIVGEVIDTDTTDGWGEIDKPDQDNTDVF